MRFNTLLVQAKEAEGLDMAEGGNVTEQLSQLDADEDDMLKVCTLDASVPGYLLCEGVTGWPGRPPRLQNSSSALQAFSIPLFLWFQGSILGLVRNLWS